MNWDLRLLIVAPLQAIFACKLMATGFLLWSLGGWAPDPSSRRYWPLILALTALAALHLTVLVGIASRQELARRLGIGLSISGLTVAAVLCILAPFGWYLAIVVLFVGLVIATSSGVALALLLTEPAREWCERESPEEVNESLGSAVAGATLGAVSGGLYLAGASGCRGNETRARSWYRQAKATKRGGTGGGESERLIVPVTRGDRPEGPRRGEGTSGHETAGGKDAGDTEP